MVLGKTLIMNFEYCLKEILGKSTGIEMTAVTSLILILGTQFTIVVSSSHHGCRFLHVSLHSYSIITNQMSLNAHRKRDYGKHKH